MPRRKEHVRFVAKVLGEDIANEYEWVHYEKDKYWRKLGKKHRVKNHGLLQSFLLGLKYMDPMVTLVSIIHDLQDYFSTLEKNIRRKLRVIEHDY